MRKRILATIAAGSAAVLMLSGFDSAMTVEQLTENSRNAMAQMTSMSATMHGEAAAAVHVSQGGENGATMDIPMNGTLDMNMTFSMEPLQADISFNYAVDAMGQGGSGSFQVYMVENEDGTGTAYAGQSADGGQMEWNASTADAETFAQVKEAVKAAMSGDLSALSSMSGDSSFDPAALTAMMDKYKEQFMGKAQLTPQSVTADGKECYELTADLNGDDISQVLTDVMSAAGQAVDTSSLQMIQPILGGFVLHMESRYDAQTFLPVDMVIDLGGSDFSALSDMIAGSMTGGAEGVSASVDVSALNMTASFKCNEPVTVTVPQDVIDAANSGSTGTDIATGGIGGLLGTDDGTDYSGLDTTDEGPIQNADGTYQIVYEDFEGNKYAANVATPEGLTLGYGSENYLGFNDSGYDLDVNYLVSYQDTPEMAVDDGLDVTFMEDNSDYSEVSRTDVMQTTLPDGTVVYYGNNFYRYNGYLLGGTVCAMQAGDSVVKFEIEKDDENNDRIAATEEEIQQYASVISPAA